MNTTTCLSNLSLLLASVLLVLQLFVEIKVQENQLSLQLEKKTGRAEHREKQGDARKMFSTWFFFWRGEVSFIYFAFLISLFSHSATQKYLLSPYICRTLFKVLVDIGSYPRKELWKIRCYCWCFTFNDCPFSLCHLTSRRNHSYLQLRKTTVTCFCPFIVQVVSLICSADFMYQRKIASDGFKQAEKNLRLL